MAFTAKNFRVFFGVDNRTASILATTAISLTFGTVALALALAMPHAGESVLRLRYTASFGVNWAAEWWKVGTFPLLAIVSLLINGWLAGRLAPHHRAYGPLVWGMTAVVEMAFAGAAFIALMLNA